MENSVERARGEISQPLACERTSYGMRKLRMVASVRAFDYSYVTAPVNSPGLGEIMEWTTPAFEEICLNCEINSYASAKLQ